MSVMPACVHSMCGKVAHVMSYAFESDFGSLLGPSAQLVSMHFQQHANRQYLQAMPWSCLVGDAKPYMTSKSVALDIHTRSISTLCRWPLSQINLNRIH